MDLPKTKIVSAKKNQIVPIIYTWLNQALTQPTVLNTTSSAVYIYGVYHTVVALLYAARQSTVVVQQQRLVSNFEYSNKRRILN